MEVKRSTEYRQLFAQLAQANPNWTIEQIETESSRQHSVRTCDVTGYSHEFGEPTVERFAR